MNFGERLKEIRVSKGMSQESFAKLLGTTKQVISRYENGARTPKISVVRRFADILNIPFSTLAGYDVSEEEGGYELSERELAHIKDYRVLDEHGKAAVDLLTEEEYFRMTGVSSSGVVKTKVIPLYTTPAAAGYASPAFGEDYEDYEVPSDSKADFACKIQGDSMEPYIKDGDIVLVKRQIDLMPGDVGLFFVDGDMKCKQYCEDSFGNIYLFSLNRKRKDADVTVWASSGIRVVCYGKVILDRRPPLPRD